MPEFGMSHFRYSVSKQAKKGMKRLNSSVLNKAEHKNEHHICPSGKKKVSTGIAGGFSYAPIRLSY
ncbi:hypothetical protein, partial [Vibrio fluvialis]|uniref:hypothetical protein n=1 Tax=Vibrio fluvialis TaxID=676 RepID=UPI001EEAC82A